MVCEKVLTRQNLKLINLKTNFRSIYDKINALKLIIYINCQTSLCLLVVRVIHLLRKYLHLCIVIKGMKNTQSKVVLRQRSL